MISGCKMSVSFIKTSWILKLAKYDILVQRRKPLKDRLIRFQEHQTGHKTSFDDSGVSES